MFKTPKFWATKNFISYALLPLSAVYFLGFFLAQIFAKKGKVSIPVICVGNLIAGGSGKTPTAIALGKILQEMGVNFAYLSRGYRAHWDRPAPAGHAGVNSVVKTLASFFRLNSVMPSWSWAIPVASSEKNAAKKFGDEPVILSEIAPAFIARNRFLGAQAIAAQKFQAILLDDGMQNNSLESDFKILVVDGKIGFGNEFLLPAGPMRETLYSGLKKADLIVVIGEARAELLEKFSDKKVIRAKILPKNLTEFSNKKLIAFCGLAYPQKFFSLIKAEKTYEFPDHHFYSEMELEKLCQEAQNKGATLVTTKKDWVKFSPHFRQKISHLDVELQFENSEKIKSQLAEIL